MSAVILDAGMSIDGYWADADGRSIFPIEEMHHAGLIQPLILRTGAVVMSRTSFEMSDDPDWYADNYEFQVPIFVFGGTTQATPPLENGKISFRFLSSFESALVAARKACGDSDVMIIGEASAAQAALAIGEVDEICLRIIPRLLGKGVPLFNGSSKAREFRPVNVTMTREAVHIHLKAC